MKVVAVFSGGIDSAVLVAKLVADGHDVTSIGFYYGQKHSIELLHASRFASKLGVPHREVDISGISPVLTGNALTDYSVMITDSMAINTVVPNRNMILLSIAGAAAISLGSDAISFAAHSGDQSVYADCRPEFAMAIEGSLSISASRRIHVLTPFIGMSKVEIIRLGQDLRIPFSDTWSCYRGGSVHCGTCSACEGRRRAFSEAGVPDATEYLK